MDKPRNKEERAFWDMCFAAVMAGASADPECGSLNYDGISGMADKALQARRERMEGD